MDLFPGNLEFEINELDENERYGLGVFGELYVKIPKEDFFKSLAIISACSGERTMAFLKALPRNTDPKFTKLKIIFASVPVTVILDTMMNMNVFEFVESYATIISDVVSTDEIITMISIETRVYKTLFDEMISVFGIEYDGDIDLEKVNDLCEKIEEKVPDCKTEIEILACEIENLADSIKTLNKEVRSDRSKFIELASDLKHLRKEVMEMEPKKKSIWTR